MMHAKEFIKRYKFPVFIYRALKNTFFRALIKTSPTLASKYLYKKNTGRKLNLRNPRDFNEKLQWLKLYWKHPLVTQCADKYEVRSYVIKTGCPEILNNLYAVHDHVEEICWDEIPEKFALKTTNACGTNIICSDKKKLNVVDAKRTITQWLKIDYSLIAAEFHYKKMRPRIIIERYLEPEDGTLPNDYKIYCFNGIAKIILVATDRDSNLKLNFLDLNWERLNIGSQDYNNGDIPRKPDCLAEMIKYAEVLSQPFPFVRVDFYNYMGKPILGEMTFTPAACAATYYNDFGLQYLGELLTLPEKYEAA